MYLFILQIFIEPYTMCQHCSRSWEYSYTYMLNSKGGETDTKQISKKYISICQVVIYSMRKNKTG